MLGRRARQLGEDCLRCAPLLELLVQVEIAQGKVREAGARAADSLRSASLGCV